MKVLQSHYDGTDRVSDAIERVIRHLAINRSTDATQTNDSSKYNTQYRDRVQDREGERERAQQRVTEWGDVLVRRPGCYLRIAMTLDLAMSRGEYPDEQAFPVWLQTSSLASSLPLCGANQQGGKSSVVDGLPCYNGRTETESGDSSRGHPSLSDNGLQLRYGVNPLGDSLRALRVENMLQPQSGFRDASLDTDSARDWLLDAQISDVLQDFC